MKVFQKPYSAQVIFIHICYCYSILDCCLTRLIMFRLLKVSSIRSTPEVFITITSNGALMVQPTIIFPCFTLTKDLLAIFIHFFLICRFKSTILENQQPQYKLMRCPAFTTR